MTSIATGEQVGFLAVLNYNSATHASPTWVGITRAKDVSVPATKSSVKLTSRASSFQFSKGAIKEVGLEFGYLYSRGTDTVFAALLDSYLNGTPIEFWAGDDLITLTGAQGLRFYGEVMEFPGDQPLEDGMTYKVKVEPTPFYVSGSQIMPDWKIT